MPLSASSSSSGPGRGLYLSITLACLILMITMGIRQTVGLFVQPIQGATGLGIAEVSMAMAIGQLAWGIFQPLFGAWSDKGRPLAALCTGLLCLAAGQLLTGVNSSFSLLILAQGILAPAGCAAGSFSVLIGIAAGRLNPEQRSVASGFINAAGSLGQFLFAPLIQFVMQLRDYSSGLTMLAGLSLMALLPSALLCRGKNIQSAPPADTIPLGLKAQLGSALRNPNYLLLHAGFFTCGFHVAFLTTHLPGEIGLHGYPASVSALTLALIGLSNIAGSIGVGFLGRRFRLKSILVLMYASRAAMIAAYLAAPKTEFTFAIFAVTTGLTWLATVPPTSGLVGKLFGTRYLATLFGLTLLTHQVGAFLGVWLGGLAMQSTGSLLWVWYMDIALAVFAALVNLPIAEEAPQRKL